MPVMREFNARIFYAGVGINFCLPTLAAGVQESTRSVCGSNSFARQTAISPSILEVAP